MLDDAERPWSGGGSQEQSRATPLAGEQRSNLAVMSEHEEPAPEAPSSSPDEVESLRRELAGADPSIVIANHCYGLFELAAVYLSETPPRLSAAQLAIDALAALVETLGERLGDATEPLTEALAQLRLAWVQLNAVTSSEN